MEKEDFSFWYCIYTCSAWTRSSVQDLFPDLSSWLMDLCHRCVTVMVILMVMLIVYVSLPQHEESLRKCGELSLELVNLREELGKCST